MKMNFVMNGSKKKALESFNESTHFFINQNQNQKRELAKTMERQITNNSFKINMFDRIKPSTNCSGCSK